MPVLLNSQILSEREPGPLSIVSEREPEVGAVCKPSLHCWWAATIIQIPTVLPSMAPGFRHSLPEWRG